MYVIYEWDFELNSKLKLNTILLHCHKVDFFQQNIEHEKSI